MNDTDITSILEQVGPQNPEAAQRLLEVVYDELRRLAAAKMSRENPGQTLVPTALVHEAWLRLGGEGFEMPVQEADDDELILMTEALDGLAVHDPRKAELVKLKYFVGLTLEEAADTIGISHRTAKRDWAYSRAWLFNEVQRLRNG